MVAAQRLVALVAAALLATAATTDAADAATAARPAVDATVPATADAAPAEARPAVDATTLAPTNGTINGTTRARMPTSFSFARLQLAERSRGASRLETFHSYAPAETGPGVFFVVFRVIQIPLAASELVAARATSTFEILEGTRQNLGPGEDPRAFSWNGTAYCLAWVHRKNHTGHARHMARWLNGAAAAPDDDWDHFLINLETGARRVLTHCVGGFRGKNWVPLVHDGQLRVVHRLSPTLRWFHYDAVDGCPAPTDVGSKRTIDSWRGGSNFVRYDATSAIALGHRTVVPDTHYPYLVHVEVASGRSTIVGLRAPSENWKGILDPTSLWRAGW